MVAVPIAIQQDLLADHGGSHPGQADACRESVGGSSADVERRTER